MEPSKNLPTRLRSNKTDADTKFKETDADVQFTVKPNGGVTVAGSKWLRLWHSVLPTSYGALLWLAPSYGIVIAYGLQFGFSLPMQVWLGCGWLLPLVLYRGTEPATRRKGLIVGAVLIGLGALGGWYRTNAVINDYNHSLPYFLNVDGVYTVRLTSVPSPMKNDDRGGYKLEGDLVSLVTQQKGSSGPIKLPADGTVVIYGQGSGDHLLPGDYVQVKGKVSPVNTMTEEGRLDLRSRYIGSHRVGTMYDGEIKSLIQPPADLSITERIANAIDRRVGIWHVAWDELFQRTLPPLWADVGSGLLLGGDYDALPQEVVNDFATTGLIHILSVSGSHVALLYAFVFFIGRVLRVPKRRAAVGAVVIVCIYCAMVGFSPPVIRSAFMGIIMGMGLINGRPYNCRQAIHLSAAMVLWWQPLQLLDVSFQLSYGATYGILLFGSGVYSRMPKGLKFVSGPVALCIAAQLLILPLQLYYFHRAGVGSLLAAITVAPILDAAILLMMALSIPTMLISGLGWLWEPVGTVLHYALMLNAGIARMPGSGWWLPSLSVYTAIAYAIGCRILYYSMAERKVPFITEAGNTIRLARRSGWLEGAMGLLLFMLPVGAVYGQKEATLVHPIPVGRGAAFIVVQQQFLHKPIGAVYLWCDGKEPGKRTIAALGNTMHYYGITVPEALVVADTPSSMNGGRTNQDSVGKLEAQKSASQKGKAKGYNSSGITVDELARTVIGTDIKSLQKAKVHHHGSRNDEGLITTVFGEAGYFTERDEKQRENGVVVGNSRLLQLTSTSAEAIGAHRAYRFGNGQIKENNLKLYGMKQVVIGTTDGSWVTVATPEKYPLIEDILYWPNGRGSNEVDPADTFVAIVGKEPIKPITL